MCGLDWLFTRLNNWLWFSGFYGGLFFPSFISSGDAAFIHAWALPAILLGRAKFFGESRPYDFPKIWAKTSLG